MAKGSERVRLMKESFMKLHEDGYSIPEIADKFNLNESTVYRHLQDIADANGVTRESLLQIVKTPSERTLQRQEELKTRVTVEGLRKGFQEVGEHIDTLIGNIEEVIAFDREEKY